MDKAKGTFKQQGSILLLSLLIVIGALAASISLGSLVIGNIQLSRISQFSLTAFYKAESGLEQAMYYIRKEFKGKSDIQGNCDDGLTLFGSDCTRTLSYKNIIEFWTIYRNQSVQFDLTDTADNPTISAGIESLKFDCPQTVSLWLDISFVPVVSSGGIWQGDYINTKHYLKPCDAAINVYVLNDFEVGKSYLVNVKALYNNFLKTGSSALKIYAYPQDDGSGTQKDFSSYLKITSTGKDSSSNQVIELEMPKRSPASSFYDYVLFSERTIQKTPVACFVNCA